MGKEREVPGTVLSGAPARDTVNCFMDLYCGRRFEYPRFADRFWTLMHKRGLPLTAISEHDAEKRIRALGTTCFVYNQEAELLGTSCPDEAMTFFRTRLKSEFSDWFLFNEQYRECVFLTHDNAWYWCVINSQTLPNSTTKK